MLTIQRSDEVLGMFFGSAYGQKDLRFRYHWAPEVNFTTAQKNNILLSEKNKQRLPPNTAFKLVEYNYEKNNV